MNKYDEGVIYGIILESLKEKTLFIDKSKVENIVLAGATFIKRELEEKHGIYCQSGPSLEGIVLREKDPARYLEPIVNQIENKIDSNAQQKICYGAFVTVYKTANPDSLKAVSLEGLKNCALYVEPVLNALGLYHNEEGLKTYFNNNRGHF